MLVRVKAFRSDSARKSDIVRYSSLGRVEKGPRGVMHCVCICGVYKSIEA